jgi:MerR family transcriptional regulator, light-induced transcriptional regulator
MTRVLPQQVFLDALLSGDRAAGSSIVHKQLENNVPIQTIYEQLIRTALYTVGELWEHNQITVAEEHLATSVSEAIMNELFAKIISRERLQKKALLACVENEYHQVGIKMVADIFEMKGWDALFLGANVPVKELIAYAGKKQPDLIALSVSIYFHMPALIQMIHEIRTAFPVLPLLVGGQAFRRGGKELLVTFPYIFFISDLFELETFIDKIMQHGQTTTH